jgi:hypothetical protein
VRVYLVQKWTSHEDMENVGVFARLADAIAHVEAAEGHRDWYAESDGLSSGFGDRARYFVIPSTVQGVP